MILVYAVRKGSNFILLHVDIQFTRKYLLKKLLFPYCVFLAPLSKISWLYMCEYFSGVSILFCWSICLSSCHDLLITIALNIFWNQEMRCSSLFFFLMIILTIGGTLWFHMNFTIAFSRKIYLFSLSFFFNKKWFNVKYVNSSVWELPQNRENDN